MHTEGSLQKHNGHTEEEPQTFGYATKRVSELTLAVTHDLANMLYGSDRLLRYWCVFVFGMMNDGLHGKDRYWKNGKQQFEKENYWLWVQKGTVYFKMLAIST